jgi:hypothetical protein
VTRACATTPQVPYIIHVQRIGMGTSPAELPMAAAWVEEAEFQDVVLPSDWAPDEKVPVIHLEAIVTPVGDNDISSGPPMATAHAVMMEPSAPMEIDGDDDPLAFARPAPSAPVEDYYDDEEFEDQNLDQQDYSKGGVL